MSDGYCGDGGGLRGWGGLQAGDMGIGGILGHRGFVLEIGFWFDFPHKLLTLYT